MTVFKIVNNGGDNASTFDSYVKPSTQGSALNLILSEASSLIVETEAFIYSTFDGVTSANCIELTGNGKAWTVTINGFAGGDAGHGLVLHDGPVTGANKVTIGSAGALSGKLSALTFQGATNVTNSGLVWGQTDAIVAAAAGTFSITNAAGAVIGAETGNTIRFTNSGTHTVANSGLISGPSAPAATAILADDTIAPGIEKITNLKTGTIAAGISLGGGADLLSNAGTLSGALDLGSGNDTLTNSGLIDAVNTTISMGTDDDSFSNTGTIYALSIDTGSGNDKLTNTGKLFKTATTDWAVIDMGSGNDTLTGGANSEWVIDAGGADKYTLGAGNDGYIAVGAASADAVDTVDGGTGIDVYDASLNTSGGITLNLDTLAHGNDAATAFWYGAAKAPTTGIGADSGTDNVKGFEKAIGSDGGDDIIFGSALANDLKGGGGADDLWGLAGNDTLSGGLGEDELFGGAGADVLDGGGSDGARDVFHFLSRSDSGLTVSTRDRISGFELGVDKIHLDFDADAVTAGTQAFASANFIALASFSGSKGDVRYVYAGPDTLVQVDTNGDRKADFSLTLAGFRLTLTAADFDFS